jgi:hypothetical protein
VRNNLKRRKIKTETIYPMCTRFDEDGGHVFFKCKNAHVAVGGWSLLLGTMQVGKRSCRENMDNAAGESSEDCGVAVEMVDDEEQGKCGRKSAKCWGGM